jgi:putative membrane protein
MIDDSEKSSKELYASTDLTVDRTRLAHERTMLAWVRTATSLITFGFGIQQFFRIARAGVADSKDLIGPNEFGLLMITIGLVALLIATLQNRSDMRALKARYPAAHIPPSGATTLAALIAILGLLALVSMIFHA